jgi:mono/diheme cytochrome c family protein
MGQKQTELEGNGTMKSKILIASLILAGWGWAGPKPPTLWKTQCASCHGMDGRVTEAGKAVGARDLSDAKYMRTRSDAQLRKAILEGTKNDKGIYTMIPYEQMLKRGDLEKLVAYVRGLAK